MSYNTQGPFKLLDGKLDIIKENEGNDESDVEDQKIQIRSENVTGFEVGKRVKNLVNGFLNPAGKGA